MLVASAPHPAALGGWAWAADFKNGWYRNGGILTRDPLLLPGATYARTGAKAELRANGSAMLFASGAPSIVPGVGYFARPAITNKCANRNANPVDLTGMTKSGDAAATLTVVDDTAAIAAAGLSEVCTSGKVYKIDNSAGTGVANVSVAGVTGNTNTHHSSAYVRGGTGSFGMGTGGSFTAAIPLAGSAGYVRQGLSYAPLATNTFLIRANAGQVIYFVLNQLVEGSLPGAIILTTGAAGNVTADVLAFPTPVANDEDFAFCGRMKLTSIPATNQILGEISNGSSNERILIYKGSGTSVVTGVNSGGGSIWSSSVAPFADGPLAILARRMAGKWSGATRVGSTVTVGGETLAGFPAGLSMVRVGSNAAGSSQANSPIEFVGIRKGTFSDADVTALLAAA